MVLFQQTSTLKLQTNQINLSLAGHRRKQLLRFVLYTNCD